MTYVTSSGLELNLKSLSCSCLSPSSLSSLYSHAICLDFASFSSWIVVATLILPSHDSHHRFIICHSPLPPFQWVIATIPVSPPQTHLLQHGRHGSLLFPFTLSFCLLYYVLLIRSFFFSMAFIALIIDFCVHDIKKTVNFLLRACLALPWNSAVADLKSAYYKIVVLKRSLPVW